MKAILSLAVLTIAFCGLLYPQVTENLKVGDEAPDFSLPYATKDSIGSYDLRLSSLFGKQSIILAFYPADWSGECTKEVCTLRDNFPDLSKLNAEILAVSGDYEYSHHEWAKHHNLPFKLIADHKHEVAKTYGSFNEAAGYNKRTVYVIDKQGKIAYIDLSYSVRDMNSFQKLQAALKDLQ
ncbi:MAG: peroxiredoxin [Ignavibacteria bacterium]|nr:peroxiredoxin [Ignavibacteria bacterium]